MKQKLFSIILATSTMLAGLVMPVTAAKFTDISGSSYEAAVNALAEKGIVSGRGDGRYSPYEELTRAEMVSIILRAYGAEEVEPIEKFIDVPVKHWAYKFVETAYQMGIVAGTTDTTFAPDMSVTYEQAVKMLVCAMGGETEAKKLGGWPDGYIKVAESYNVLNGIDGTKGKPITRGVMAQLVYNCLNVQTGLDYMIDWTGVAKHYDWIKNEKIRAVYDSVAAVTGGENGYLKKLENAGINTVFMNIIHGSIDYKTPEGVRKILDETAEHLKKYDLHSFIKINFGDNGYAGNTAFGQFHPGIHKDSYFSIPCPLSEKYWEKQMLERALIIAEYSEFDGIILDFEMYSGGISSYTSSCMCDDCWEKFVTEKKLGGEWAAVDAEKRSDFITQKDKKDDYNNWHTAKITKLFNNVRDKVWAIKPDTIFAYMPSFDWIKGMTRGLGTDEKPVIVLSENEYWGSLGDTKARMKQIKDENYPAIYLPGLYPGKAALSASKLEEKIKQVAPTTAGYWMYSGTTLSEIEENYGAVERANAQLDKEIASGELTAIPDYDIRSYTAKKAAGNEPTEDEWNKMPVTEDFVHYQQGLEGKVLVRSNAKVMYTDDYIYVRVIAYDDMSKVSVGAKNVRDADGGDVDRASIFWRFEGTTNAAQFRTDLAGSLWDGYSTGIGNIDSSVNFDGYDAETKLFDDRWEMTIRVPNTLDGIKKAKRGDVLRMQIYRSHPASAAQGAVSSHCWAPTYGSYLGSPSLWGTVKLG
ncbi:MAG: S-layer homology domain-containing protein [Clostridia bacterium]|nr:S-layer homology domain-containing protein [Clostridia bacterium]